MEIFYIHREGITFLHDSNPIPKPDRFVVRPIGPSLIQTIASNPESLLSEETIRKRLSDGHLGYCILHQGNLAAFMWADLEKINFRNFPLPMKKHEAYLYNALTVSAYRGKNLAPYLRLECYRRLERLGRNRFYSVTGLLNLESMRFKKKLGARPVLLFLAVTFFMRKNFLVLLKKY
jgi:hypothetical protein